MNPMRGPRLRWRQRSRSRRSYRLRSRRQRSRSRRSYRLRSRRQSSRSRRSYRLRPRQRSRFRSSQRSPSRSRQRSSSRSLQRSRSRARSVARSAWRFGRRARSRSPSRAFRRTGPVRTIGCCRTRWIPGLPARRSCFRRCSICARRARTLRGPSARRLSARARADCASADAGTTIVPPSMASVAISAVRAARRPFARRPDLLMMSPCFARGPRCHGSVARRGQRGRRHTCLALVPRDQLRPQASPETISVSRRYTRTYWTSKSSRKTP